MSKMRSARREPPKHLLSIAIIGAGLGGLAAAATLRANGIEVRVYEQASRFARIGAGIQMLPNSMKVLRRIGIEERLRDFAFAPRSHLNREWDSGDIRAELPMPEDLYGAPYLCMHRGDLHDALASLVPATIVELGKKLVGLDARDSGVELAFADGTRAHAGPLVRSLARRRCSLRRDRMDHALVAIPRAGQHPLDRTIAADPRRAVCAPAATLNLPLPTPRSTIPI